MSDIPKIEPLILCPDCKIEMRLFGIEPESDVRDLYTFECHNCGRLEARGVLVAVPHSSEKKD
jgi:hypothetical protein